VVAFTLIELLVVIAIIALLMAILLPTLQRARRQAKAVVCRANLKEWGKTLAVYTEDSQGHFLPRITQGIWFLRGSALSEDDPYKPDLQNNVDTEGIACCPMAVKPGVVAIGGYADVFRPSSVVWQVLITGGSTYRAWVIAKPGPPFRCSYGFNDWLWGDFHPYSHSIHSSPFGLDIVSLRGKDNIPALADCVEPCSAPREDSRPPTNELTLAVSGMARFCMDRHDGHVNSLFLDWSVRRIGLKELWTLKWHGDFNTAGPWTKAGGVKPEDWPQWMRRFKDY